MKASNRTAARKKSSTVSRGALFFIALLLISSGALRLGSPALATDLIDAAEGLLKAPSAARKEVDPVVDIAPELVELLKETREREVAVAEREKDLAAHAQTLKLIEENIERDLKRLEQAEAELLSTMATADKAAENDIGKLTAVYENMKPEQASKLFQMMEPSFAAGFLGRMRPDAAAAILAGLTPELAYTVSVVLAGRNAEVPREPLPEPNPPNDMQ